MLYSSWVSASLVFGEGWQRECAGTAEDSTESQGGWLGGLHSEIREYSYGDGLCRRMLSAIKQYTY